MNDIILATYAISKIYQDGIKEVRAVDGISIEIKKGKSVAVVGPSGAGKSTLLHMVGGLDKPTSGSAVMDGIDIYGLSNKERSRLRNRSIGFVFQFYHLLPEFTALENVMLPALIKGPESRVKEKAEGLLESVGLGDRMDHLPSRLSGGESQRVAIARSLINGPKLLFCDEPTGNLDSKTSASIYDLLFTLQSQNGMTLVIVSHNESISSRVEETIRVKDGKII